MAKKYTMQTRLSLSSLDELIKKLETTKKNFPQVALRITDRLANEMLTDAYPDTEKIPATLIGNTAISGIRNNESKWVFHEYGTGIIGSQVPHVADILAKAGWKYDVNGHGEKGWWYPTTESDPNPYKWTDESGTLRAWTKGLPANRAFYDALKRAEEMFPNIAVEELMKEIEGG